MAASATASRAAAASTRSTSLSRRSSDLRPESAGPPSPPRGRSAHLPSSGRGGSPASSRAGARRRCRPSSSRLASTTSTTGPPLAAPMGKATGATARPSLVRRASFRGTSRCRPHSARSASSCRASRRWRGRAGTATRPTTTSRRRTHSPPTATSSPRGCPPSSTRASQTRACRTSAPSGGCRASPAPRRRSRGASGALRRATSLLATSKRTRAGSRSPLSRAPATWCPPTAPQRRWRW
mmetsp:Transcript_35410/g.114185  ORF Transcript_35410/g.114185 Transcript_35410/m.114185 type:complete len:239 (-) Transcript_35410:441-1157(-)